MAFWSRKVFGFADIDLRYSFLLLCERFPFRDFLFIALCEDSAYQEIFEDLSDL